MPAYVSASVIVKDPNKLKIYLEALPATLQPFGGRPVARGKVSQILQGSNDAHIQAVFEFADAAAANAWYQSDAYQALIPNRDEALEGSIVILES